MYTTFEGESQTIRRNRLGLAIFTPTVARAIAEGAREGDTLTRWNRSGYAVARYRIVRSRSGSLTYRKIARRDGAQWVDVS